MSRGHLTIDLAAIVDNWRALDAKSSAETAAVVKANGYGLGAQKVGKALADAGARRFFVAMPEEGRVLREAIGSEPEISVFCGHMDGDTDVIRSANLVPMLNSIEQVERHLNTLPDHAFGVQLDTGMNRLGLELDDWAQVASTCLAKRPTLIMSHLACADEPDHPMNAHQLATFKRMTDGIATPRSLAATGGILLGADYHFDVTRPGVGLYGAFPFVDGRPVLRMDFPVIQVRTVKQDEIVGYSNTWQAKQDSRIATISAGYADGLIRALSGNVTFYADDIPCPAVGRVSMDLITVDVTALQTDPQALCLVGPNQGVDAVAKAAGTIGYEILTSLGARYSRRYIT